MKRTTAVFSILGLALGLTAAAGCGKSTDGKDTAPPPSTAAAPAPAAGDMKKIAVPGARGGIPEGVGTAAAAPTEPAAAAQVYVTDGSGKRSKDGTYTIAVAGPNEAVAGAASKIEISVAPADGWKMNKEFPTRLQLTSPDGVTVAKAEQRLADAAHFDDHKLTFAVEFTPSSAGEKKFTADFKFAVCTESTCDPKTESLAWVVNVN